MRVFLTGFMGCGKTTTGRLLARRLRRPFIDLDDITGNKLTLGDLGDLSVTDHFCR